MKWRLPKLVAAFGTSPAHKVENPFGPLLHQANTLRDAGRAAEAAVAYQKALDLAPDRHDIRVQLGNMLKDSGQLQAAEAAYRAALLQSDQADTHLQLGHVLKALRQRTQALAQYRRALELDPNTPGALHELAQAGDERQQQRQFDMQIRAGGPEALLTLSQTIADLRAELDQLNRTLPELQAQAAFPIALYGAFRDFFPIPAAPMAPPTHFHLVLLAEREAVVTLFAQISAIQAQSRQDWTLRVLGHSADRARVVALAAAADPRITWVTTEAESPLARTEQIHAGDHAAEWVVLFAPQAVLDRQALAWFAQAALWSCADALISDEETGRRTRARVARASPILRQVADFDSLLQTNTCGETIAVRADVYRQIQPALPMTSITAARVAMLLTLLSGNRRIAHVPYPLIWRTAPTAPVTAEHRNGVAAYLAWAGLTERVDPAPEPGQSPIWQPSQPAAGIATIILTRDNAADVHDLIDTLRQTAAAPAALEFIVVDNGSTKPADLCILHDLTAADNVQVIRKHVAFNWSHLNNVAAAQTNAPLLVFANDDMRMLTPGWDTRLRGLLERDEVGAVGVRLLYEDDTVQHAGVLFGWKGSVIHDGLYEPADRAGPTHRWQVTRAVGAVTGAFLATRRSRFFELGGFDATLLPVAYSDIDFSLKLRAAGLKVLWTPAITLYHYESKTRGMDHTDAWRSARNTEEHAALEARWGPTLDCEPGVHPCWHAATLPFRLITAASAQRVRDHIILTGAQHPWTVSPPHEQAQQHCQSC